jgi:hypothetical protein
MVCSQPFSYDTSFTSTGGIFCMNFSPVYLNNISICKASSHTNYSYFGAIIYPH